jgi:hypothetical protein
LFIANPIFLMRQFTPFAVNLTSLKVRIACGLHEHKSLGNQSKSINHHHPSFLNTIYPYQGFHCLVKADSPANQGKSLQVNLKSGDSGASLFRELNLSLGYKEIKIKRLQKSGTDFAKIKNLRISSEKELVLDLVKDNTNSRFY